MSVVIKPKKKCCKDSPQRCKRCPVVCKRAVKEGLARQRKDGSVVLAAELTKKLYKELRKR